jgi:hypothetical protein
MNHLTAVGQGPSPDRPMATVLKAGALSYRLRALSYRPGKVVLQ